MDEKKYKQINEFLVRYRYGPKILKISNKIITGLVYTIYPLLLVWLFLNRDTRALRVLVVPGIGFNVLSIFRKYFNAPRPYEKLDIDPILKKETKGNSFPSRHVFSIFLIAMAFYYINPYGGIFLMGLGTILAIIRVVGGVHFPRDVVAGSFLGLIFGIIGFYII